MKIAVIGAKGVPPKQGGIEHYCAEMYPRIVSEGHSVDLYGRSSYTKEAPFQHSNYQGVHLISLPGSGWRGIDAFVTSALGTAIASTQNYDVIHFHALGPALFTWLPRIVSSTRIVVTCQGLDWQRDKWGKTSSRLIYLGEKAAVRFAHSIIVVSKELQSYFWETYGRETIYIPNGPASYADSDPTFAYGTSLGLTQNRYMVFLGRLVPEKCPDLLLQAFQQLQPTGWKLVFVGGNSDTTSFTTSLSKMSAGNPNILFTGELRGSRLAEIVRGAGLFVLPSNLEGLPLAMLEAMQEGIPILASDILPHQQLLNDGRGVLFKAGDLDDLVRQISWVIDRPDAMQVMANSAFDYVRLNHDWGSIALKTLRVYEQSCRLNSGPEHRQVVENVLRK